MTTFDIVDKRSGDGDVIALLRNRNLIRESLAGLDRVGLGDVADADRFEHEVADPSSRSTAPHVHVQLGRGKKGGRGDLPKNPKCPC